MESEGVKFPGLGNDKKALDLSQKVQTHDPLAAPNKTVGPEPPPASFSSN